MRVNKLYVFAFFIGVGAVMFLMRPNEKDLVRMHELSGDAAKAQALLEGLYEESPNNPQVIAALARQYRLTGRTEEAVRLMNRLCDLEPHQPEHYEALIAFYHETYQTRRMLAERERLIGALESNLKTQISNLKSQDSNLKSQDSNLKSQISDSEFETRLLKEYRDLASLYSSHEQPYKQAELYKRAIQVLPREKSLTVDYINLLLSYQSPADLLPLLDAAVKNFPNDARIVDIAIGTAFKQGDPARAERYARGGIEGRREGRRPKQTLPHSHTPTLPHSLPTLPHSTFISSKPFVCSRTILPS